MNLVRRDTPPRRPCKRDNCDTSEVSLAKRVKSRDHGAEIFRRNRFTLSLPSLAKRESRAYDTKCLFFPPIRESVLDGRSFDFNRGSLRSVRARTSASRKPRMRKVYGGPFSKKGQPSRMQIRKGEKGGERRAGNRRDNTLCVYELRDETIPAWSQRVNPISFLQNFQEKFGLRWRGVVRHTCVCVCVCDAGRRFMLSRS